MFTIGVYPRSSVVIAFLGWHSSTKSKRPSRIWLGRKANSV